MKKQNPETILYILFDYLSALLAWGCFFHYRKTYIESVKYGQVILPEYDLIFFVGLFLLPTLWVLFYYARGNYEDVRNRSRLQELAETISTSLQGVIVLFFTLILDDTIVSYINYYQSFSALLLLHFSFTYIPRFILTNRTVRRIRKGILGFNTLIIGSNDEAVLLYKHVMSQPKSTGHKFVGFIRINGASDGPLSEHLPCMGDYDNLADTIRAQSIEEVIIAIETTEHDEIGKILNKLYATSVSIKVIPNTYDMLTGTVSISNLYGEPFLEISHRLMPPFQENMKRVLDVCISVFALILFLPLYIALAIGVRISSDGPLFYWHYRIGRYGKPFKIYKFRSMYVDAEKNGPALSSTNDPRITTFGRFMRKSRLDELPQFLNVLFGDMSLVGPRPERQYYIDKIVQEAPQYFHLLKVRPGITSWGQVKYGYAENVEEMIERMYYDLVYIENMSLYVDLKILIYTVKIVFQGTGK